jgi:DNA-binding MarR family transcriptional regulator
MQSKDKSETVEIPLSRKLTTTLIKKGTEITEAISAVLKMEKITIQQFNVLRILRGRQGKPASLQQVSKDMLHTNSNTTRVVDKLVDKNLVERVQCPGDRRKIELTITDDGLDLLKKLDSRVDECEMQIVKDLNKHEMQMVIEILGKI